MLDSQQKRKINHILYHKATIIIMSIIVIFIISSVWVVYNKKLESERLRDISLRHKEELEMRNSELDSQIDRLNTDAGKEAEIRSRFGVAKDNEHIVVVVDGVTTTEPTNPPASLWQKIFNFFKK